MKGKKNGAEESKNSLYLKLRNTIMDNNKVKRKK